VFIVGSTLFGLLLPALVITRIADGPDGLRALWRRAVDVRVSLGWYAFALLVVPLAAVGIVLALDGAPAEMSASAWGSVLLGNLLLPFLLTWLPNNWWEEVAWMGFVQARLQHRHGPWLAAVIVGPLFAVQHVALAADRSLAEGAFLITVLAVFAVGFRFLAGWVYNRTAGLFIVGLMHGAGNAVTGGSGFQDGLLARLYPESSVATMSHLLAFLVIGLIVVAVTRGRLGQRSADAER
jgi:membrane protease YdiL (CAAX protease family)